MAEENAFFSLAFRMKYIRRWGLMRLTEQENLLEHSAECAMLAHALACIGNTFFGKHYDEGALAVKALYHDISEIYTGDLPTPVKYHDDTLTDSYKQIEKEACDQMLSRLPDELKPSYVVALDHESEKEQARLLKAADKLCALIKCMHERQFGNHEFDRAYETTRHSVETLATDCEELAYFIEHFLADFEKTLDETGLRNQGSH